MKESRLVGSGVSGFWFELFERRVKRIRESNIVVEVVKACGNEDAEGDDVEGKTEEHP